eukprot:361833-Amphidinium_carterae.1
MLVYLVHECVSLLILLPSTVACRHSFVKHTPPWRFKALCTVRWHFVPPESRGISCRSSTPKLWCMLELDYRTTLLSTENDARLNQSEALAVPVEYL